jgi:uncharacterized protein (TIGR00288 family)
LRAVGRGPNRKEGFVAEERLKVAVFIDFDNIQIGVKETLGKEFDVSLVLESLKERGEVVAKIAYGDWARAGDYSRQMTQHAIQMVQRSVTPRGDKNGADINLALDALEMAFTRHHINSFAIVGGDSDFMALVEKLKQFDKRVFVIGGRSFTSNILQRNCTEFIAYENLLKSDAPRSSRASRREGASRSTMEIHPLSEALPNIRRALKILADRGVAAQLGLLKSTLLQLDSTFTERDYGAGSFLEFMQKIQEAGLARIKRVDRGYLVESDEAEDGAEPAPAEAESTAPTPEPAVMEQAEPSAQTPEAGDAKASPTEALELLRQALAAASQKGPNRPLYMRQIRQALKSLDPAFDEHRYGLRGTLDLLHHAQREGWVRLQRDHKGVWRVFCVGVPGEPSVAEGETASEVPAAETSTLREPIEETAEVGRPPESPFEPLPSVEAEVEVSEETQEEPAGEILEFALAAPEVPAAEPQPEAKPKRKRAARSGPRPARRPARRKAKEPAAE